MCNHDPQTKINIQKSTLNLFANQRFPRGSLAETTDLLGERFSDLVFYFRTFHRVTGRSLISNFHDHPFPISISNFLFFILIRFWVSRNFSIFRVFWIWRVSTNNRTLEGKTQPHDATVG